MLRAMVLAATALLVPAAPADEQRGSSARQRPHVVLLVMDEFPSDSLLDRSGRIDPVRYPNFAALAGDATWFRNGYSIYDSTTKAVPLILDGVKPRPGDEPDRRFHPHTIFDVVARHGYRVVASEDATAMCAPSICPGARRRHPPIVRNLLHGRVRRFNRWVRSIEANRQPHLWMKHLLLPHGPYKYLPSGARAHSRTLDLLPDMASVPGFHDEFLTRHNEQRYLLQLGYTDRLLGRLIRKLKREGIYDDTLLVVTADHGISFQVGVQSRRSVSASNVEELAPVPFFVKRPGQRRGRVSEAYARTLDVTPTIADVLGFRLGYRADGRSAFSKAVRRRRSVWLTKRYFDATVRISGRRWEARRRAVVRRRLRDFGSGEWASLYTGIGPNQALIGRAVSSLSGAATDANLRASILEDRLFADVGRVRGVVPTEIVGELRGGRPGERRELAVAVNGRVEAVGRSFYLVGDPAEHFAFNVPESSLRAGRNSVELFEVLGGDRLRRLAGA